MFNLVLHPFPLLVPPHSWFPHKDQVPATLLPPHAHHKLALEEMLNFTTTAETEEHRSVQKSYDVERRDYVNIFKLTCIN